MIKQLLAISLLLLANTVLAEDKIKLKAIKIKGNKELPKILYVVPWQETKKTKQKKQKLKLHNLFDGLYQPMHVSAPKTLFDDK